MLSTDLLTQVDLDLTEARRRLASREDAVILRSHPDWDRSWGLRTRSGEVHAWIAVGDGGYGHGPTNHAATRRAEGTVDRIAAALGLEPAGDWTSGSGVRKRTYRFAAPARGASEENDDGLFLGTRNTSDQYETRGL